mgnify:FL=1
MADDRRQGQGVFATLPPRDATMSALVHLSCWLARSLASPGP